jgi:hypothetical protein
VALVGLGVLVLAFGSSNAVLGSYSVTVSQGSLLPGGWPGSVIDHIALVAVGIGVVPVSLGIAFVLATLGRPVAPRVHALAVVYVVVVIGTTLAVTSFDLRFTSGGGVQERYLFYICPLLFAGAIGWFGVASRASWPAAVGAVAGGFLVLQTTMDGRLGFASFASPNRYVFTLFDGRAQQVGGWVGIERLTPEPFIALSCVAAVAAVVLLVRAGRGRQALAGLGAVLGLFLAAQLVYSFPKVVADHNISAINAFGAAPLGERDWIDDHVHRRVGGIQGVINSRGEDPFFNPGVDAGAWWQVEFWNKALDRIYAFRGRDGLTLGPDREMRLDFRTGAIEAEGADFPGYLVMSTTDVRFAPEFRGTPVSYQDLTLYRTPKPYRADWATQEIAEDGWTDPDHGGILRVYAPRDQPAALRRISLKLALPLPEKRAPRYTISGPGVERRGRARKVSNEGVDVCVPADGHADLRIDVDRPTELSPDRFVGLRVVAVSSRPTGRACRAAS